MTDSLLALLVALLGGAAVGVERQWSGHATGPQARLAGVRTFALLGAVGGIAGRLWVWNAGALAGVLLLVAGLLIIVGYVVASRQDVDATTEVAALIVVGAGVAAGLDQLGVASAIVSVTALLLYEKSQLHDLINRLEGPELSAALRFAVMAVVILPLLPAGPIGTWGGGLRPREVWILVLLFSGLSFLGYIAQRIVGASHGQVLAGLLGGLASSTSVTLAFARRSRMEPALARPLSHGVIAANTVIYARVLVAAGILSPALAAALLPVLVGPAMIGVAATVSGLRRTEPDGETASVARNPLQLRAALEMAIVFQVVLLLVAFIRAHYGAGGLLGTAVVVGLNDVDALTLSMAHEVSAAGIDTGLAARTVAVGLLSNTCVKLALAIGAGAPAFRTPTAVVLVLMGLALLAGVLAAGRF